VIFIFGVRVSLRTVGSGRFHCPREEGDRRFLRRRAQRVFTVLFLPVLPVGRLGDVIECQSCGGRFHQDVLLVPTSADLADRMADAVRVAVAGILRADAPVTTVQRRAAVDVLARYLPGAAETWLDADAGADDPGDVSTHARQLATVLSAAGRESLLASVAWVAAADGPVSTGARVELARLGAGLGMSPAHVRGVIDSVADASSSRPHG
jgi:hypothetical protein